MYTDLQFNIGIVIIFFISVAICNTQSRIIISVFENIYYNRIAFALKYHVYDTRQFNMRLACNNTSGTFYFAYCGRAPLGRVIRRTIIIARTFILLGEAYIFQDYEIFCYVCKDERNDFNI